MGRSALPTMLQIGSIKIETQDLYIAREMAAVIQAASTPDVTEGLVLLHDRQIRLWRIPSNLNPSHIAKKRDTAR